MEIKVSSLFEQQLIFILDYYQQIDPDLAKGVLDEIELTKVRVSDYPEAFPNTDIPGIRKVLLRKFPYRIRFRRVGNELLFLTIRHAARLE